MDYEQDPAVVAAREEIEPPCTKMRHAWGVLQKIRPNEGYFDCNRRDCNVRRWIRLDDIEMKAIYYEEVSVGGHMTYETDPAVIAARERAVQFCGTALPVLLDAYGRAVAMAVKRGMPCYQSGCLMHEHRKFALDTPLPTEGLCPTCEARREAK